MTAAATVVQFPRSEDNAMRCIACGIEAEVHCNCGKGVKPMKPLKAAKLRIKTHPDDNDQEIADALGIGAATVWRARKSVSSNERTGKRRGKDGKMYSTTKTKKQKEQSEKVRPVIRAKLLADEPVTRVIIATEHGVGENTAHIVLAEERARLDTLQELNVDPETLTLSAKAKLEVSTRVMQRKLAAEHADRMRNLDEEVRQRVLAETKEYLEMVKAREADADKTISSYQEFLNNHEPLFTEEQFKTILMCLHPDGQRTASKLTEAFRLFNSKKFQLTRER